MAFVIGMNGKLYRNTGAYGSPVWNEIPNVKDVKVTLDPDTASAATRNNNGYNAKAATLKNLAYEFEMVWDPTDADMIAIRDAFLNNTTLDVVALDGGSGVSGSQGPRAICMVTKFGRDEPLSDFMKVPVMLEPTYNTTSGPTWYTA